MTNLYSKKHKLITEDEYNDLQWFKLQYYNFKAALEARRNQDREKLQEMSKKKSKAFSNK